MNVIDEKGNSVWEEHCPQYSYDELEFDDMPKDMQKGKITEPDYWEKLKHQYAGMAMHGYIIAAHVSRFNFRESDMKDCVSMATALVNKLKEKEND